MAGPTFKRWTLPPILFSCLVFAVSLAVYLVTLPRGVLPGDSGELIAASYTLSLGHPPGFPLYLMLGKLFASLFAFGSIAYRHNLFSAVLASATAGLVFLILVRVGVGRLLGFAVALGLATLGSYWLQATTGDIYSLNALFTALLIYIALGGRRYGERTLLLLGFVGGLAISHHLTLVYGLASALVIFACGMENRPQAKTIILSAFFLCTGLTVWLYVPIRSSLGPPITWGDTHSLSGLLAHITARTFRWRLMTTESERWAVALLHYFQVLARTGGPMVFLALLGLILNLRRFKLVGGLVLLVALYGFHYVVYNIPDIESHVFPALVAIAVLGGMGLQRGCDLRRSPRIAHVAAVALASLIVVLNLLHIQPRKDEWFALDYAHAIKASAVAACGTDCIIVCYGDASFPLVYDSFTGASGVRVFHTELTNPKTVGLEEGPKTVEGWVAAAIGAFGSSRVALFGGGSQHVAGRPTKACGLVRIMSDDPTACPSPLDYAIRGVGQDLRDRASRVLSGDYYTRLAHWCTEREDALGARGYIARALSLSYDDAPTYLDAANIYRDMGKAGEARQLVTTALKIDPASFEAHAMLASLELRAGNAVAAIAEYKKALEATPAPGPLYSNLGAAYLAKKDYSAARESFDRAIALDPTLVSAHVGVGLVLEAQGRLEEALSYYDRALGHDPSSEIAKRSRAALLVRMGK